MLLRYAELSPLNKYGTQGKSFPVQLHPHIKTGCQKRESHSSEAMRESRWPSLAVRPNEPSGFRGRKAILNHASALVTACS